MKTRTPDLLGMSYACANMVHSPGYADDLRQYTSLNSFLNQMLTIIVQVYREGTLLIQKKNLTLIEFNKV